MLKEDLFSLIQFPDLQHYQNVFYKQQIVFVPNFLPNFLNQHLLEQSAWMVKHYAKRVNRSVNQNVLNYQVVTGDVIREYFKDLYDLYRYRKMLEWIRGVTQSPKIHTSNYLQSSININYMDQISERYPWHFDAIPYTALLFLTSSMKSDGGEFEVYPNIMPANDVPTSEELISAVKFSFVPKAGSLIIMNGACCYHSVSALRSTNIRITIPMVYTQKFTHQRPHLLDDKIY